MLPSRDLPASAFAEGRSPRLAPLVADGSCGPALSAVINVIVNGEAGAVSNLREPGTRATRVAFFSAWTHPETGRPAKVVKRVRFAP